VVADDEGQIGLALRLRRFERIRTHPDLTVSQEVA
jgi:hypothetical protein